MRRRRLCLPWVIALVGALLVLAGTRRGCGGLRALVTTDFALTLTSGERTEVLGPLYQRTDGEDTEQTWAFPPLFSRRSDPRDGFHGVRSPLPAAHLRPVWIGYRCQFFQIFSFAGGTTTECQAKRAVHACFPFTSQQRSSDPALNYTALFPFYGHLENRFFRDEISFVMFPLYLRSRKRRRRD